jgi:hypothetical protein
MKWSWNYLGIAIGPPECGKTFHARFEVVPHLDEGGWAFVSDPNVEYRKLKFPDGRAVPFLPWFPTANAWRDYMRARRKQGLPISRGNAIGGDPGDVIDLCIELGEKWNRVDCYRMRMLFVVDEGVQVETSGATWISKREAKLISNRRHLGIGIHWLTQDAADVHKKFLKLATDVFVWNCSEDGLDRVEKKLSLPRDSLVRNVPQLPPFAHIHAKQRAFV